MTEHHPEGVTRWNPDSGRPADTTLAEHALELMRDVVAWHDRLNDLRRRLLAGEVLWGDEYDELLEATAAARQYRRPDERG